MPSELFNVRHQLIFYGQYHNNKYNIMIHMLFVPIIIWTSFIILACLPRPAIFPSQPIGILPPYLSFEWSWAVVFAGAYAMYYFALEPVAALLYYPQQLAMLLSAGPIAATTWGLKTATYFFVVAWVVQFMSHGFVEKRAPALKDNILGAFVLAPFFVHLELLFALGYRPRLHREVANGVGVEIAKYRKKQGDARRVKTL
ncbi:DUF962-domain-containing protein [Ramaria rubella]|nr:DUF962-domain-containing protein [Ramaria rubella]